MLKKLFKGSLFLELQHVRIVARELYDRVVLVCHNLTPDQNSIKASLIGDEDLGTAVLPVRFDCKAAFRGMNAPAPSAWCKASLYSGASTHMVGTRPCSLRRSRSFLMPRK